MTDIAQLTLAEIKILLTQEGAHMMPLLAAMAADSRKSVRSLAAAEAKKEARRRAEEERLRVMLQYEEALYKEGARYIAGIDEAGRGPAAGPVTVAAVILPAGWMYAGIDDSKKVPPHKREVFYNIIAEQAVALACVSKSEREIDNLDIYHATMAAMYEAVEALSVRPDAVIVDAMPLRDLPMRHLSLVGGDGKSFSVAAASIIAKVTRDRIMEEYDGQYPQYGFGEHKGYLTQAHRDAIVAYGPCPIHRKSFEPIKSMVHFER